MMTMNKQIKKRCKKAKAKAKERRLAMTTTPEIGAGRHCVLVVGAGCSGRTCAVVRFLHDYFMDVYDPHLLLDSYPCTVGGAAVALVDGPAVLNAETPWVDRDYAALVPTARGMLAVFDVTQRQTMTDMYAIVAHTQALRQADGLAPLPFAVLGTHIDRVDARVVTTDEPRAAADAHGASYAEVSARTGENVRAAFTDAIMSFIEGPNDNGDTPKDRKHHGCTHQ